MRSRLAARRRGLQNFSTAFGIFQLPPPLCLGSSPPGGSPLAAEPKPRAFPPLRFGEPAAGLLPANNHASGLTWSGPTSLPLRLTRVVPDLRVGMRRVVSPLRGEARPQKRFCPPRTRSPHLNLSQPPFEAWCADPIHPHFHSGWQLGDAFVFPPLQPVHSPPASRMLGDTAVSLLQCTEPVPATRSTSLSVIPSKDAEGSPSRWRVPLLPGLLDTPSQVCLPLHDTMIPLSHFLHEWERLPGVSLWVLRTIRTGYTLQFGKNPPRFDGVHLTVVNSAAKASVLQQELSSLLQKGAIEEVPQSEVERGFFSRYFLVPKRDGGLKPILDLRRLNLSLYKGKFKMLTMRTIMSQVQEGDEGERCPSPSHSPILALPDLVLGANSPLVSASLGESDQAGLTVPASGQDLASSAGALEVVGMAHTGPRAVIDGLPAEVQETIASARAPATRKLYSSKWGVFESWCLTRAIDPVNCPVGPVLEFLQERLTAGVAATTLRVYVAAIAARRELDEIPLGRHRLVSAFMRGARRLRPVRPTAVPSWDLSVVLEGLVTAPFEPLESASDRILTLKVVLLLALTSLKRVGDLQAFSVSETCMDFAPGLVKVTLRPRPGYIPKGLSTSFRSQVVTLHSFHPPPFASSEDERLHMLCPVRALKLYVDRSKVWRKSPQLLICFCAGRRGLATSKQRISHWVRDAISLAYEARELPSPLSLRAHSTRGVASSQALFRGVPLEDICVAAGWSSPHTFVRFYNLDVDTAPGSQVLSVWTDRMLLVHYWAR